MFLSDFLLKRFNEQSCSHHKQAHMLLNHNHPHQKQTSSSSCLLAQNKKTNNSSKVMQPANAAEQDVIIEASDPTPNLTIVGFHVPRPKNAAELKEMQKSYLVLQAKLAETFQELKNSEARFTEKTRCLEEELDSAYWSLNESTRTISVLENVIEEKSKEINRLFERLDHAERELVEKTKQLKQAKDRQADLEDDLKLAKEDLARSERLETALCSKIKQMETDQQQIKESYEGELNKLASSKQQTKAESSTDQEFHSEKQTLLKPKFHVSKEYTEQLQTQKQTSDAIARNQTIRCKGYLAEVLMALLSDARARSVESVEMLIQRGADVNCRFSNGLTPLSYIASADYMIDYVKLLLEHGADVNLKDTVRFKTPLMRAAAGGAEEVVKLLIDFGASLDERDKVGKTALIYAMETKQLKTAEILVDHLAQISIQDETGNTALHYAAANGDDDAVRLLISSGQSIRYEATNNYGYTALNISKNCKSLRRLLQDRCAV